MEYPLDISVLEKCDEEGYDAEVRLIQQAFDYKTKGVYLSLATKNQKPCIRRKAEKVLAQNGEIFYQNTKGGAVYLYICIYIYILMFELMKS